MQSIISNPIQTYIENLIEVKSLMKSGEEFDFTDELNEVITHLQTQRLQKNIETELYKEGATISLQFNIGKSSSVFSFSEEEFEKFRESINKPPYGG